MSFAALKKSSGASRRQQSQGRGAVEKSLQGRNKLAQGGTGVPSMHRFCACRGGGSPGDAFCGCPTRRSYVWVPTSHLGVSAIRAASSRRWLASGREQFHSTQVLSSFGRRTKTNGLLSGAAPRSYSKSKDFRCGGYRGLFGASLSPALSNQTTHDGPMDQRDGGRRGANRIERRQLARRLLFSPETSRQRLAGGNYLDPAARGYPGQPGASALPGTRASHRGRRFGTLGDRGGNTPVRISARQRRKRCITSLPAHAEAGRGRRGVPTLSGMPRFVFFCSRPDYS